MFLKLKKVTSIMIIFLIFVLSIDMIYASVHVKVELLKEYQVNSSTTIRIPQITQLDNQEIAKQINDLFLQTIDDYVNEIQDQQLHQVNTIDYQVYYLSDDILSLSINCTQINASSYLQKTFFNIQLKTGQLLSIQDVLGQDYQHRIIHEVQKQIKENQNNSPMLYFNEAIYHLSIPEHQSFYINESKQVVVVFNEYEIAPGYMGMPEFIIGTIS